MRTIWELVPPVLRTMILAQAMARSATGLNKTGIPLQGEGTVSEQLPYWFRKKITKCDKLEPTANNEVNSFQIEKKLRHISQYHRGPQGDHLQNREFLLSRAGGKAGFGTRNHHAVMAIV